jgi:hypothetical protein
LGLAALLAATPSLSAQEYSSGFSATMTQLDPAQALAMMRSITAIGWTSPGGNYTAMAAATSFSQWASAAGLSPFFLGATFINKKSFSDDVPNILRYAMNLDTTGQGALLPQPVMVATDDGPAITLTYRQRKGMVDVVLIPQYSADLVNWVRVPPESIQQLPDDDAQTERFCVTMLAVSGQSIYLRVIAQPNNGPVVQWTVASGGNGHYYQAIAGLGLATFSSAQTYASAHGGYVVTLTSAAENAFVFNLVQAPQFLRVIATPASSGGRRGGPSPVVAGVYGPLLGVTPGAPWPMQWVNNEGVLTYTNWASGQTPAVTSVTQAVEYFWGDAANPQPTWITYGRSIYYPSFVVEFDTNPADN